MMDEWMNELMNGWMDGWMNGRMNGRIDGRRDGWMDGWMDGWRDGWQTCRSKQSEPLCPPLQPAPSPPTLCSDPNYTFRGVGMVAFVWLCVCVWVRVCVCVCACVCIGIGILAECWQGLLERWKKLEDAPTSRAWGCSMSQWRVEGMNVQRA